MRSVFAVWKKTTNFLSRIAITLILSLAYYLLITPVALIKRLFGGRPLPVKPDRNVQSYWVARAKPLQPKESFSKRY